MTKRARVYCRTSSDDASPDGCKSIPEQEADCLKLCEDHGYEIVGDVIKEPDRSGCLWWTGAPLAAMDTATIEHSKRMRHQRRDKLADIMNNLDDIDVIVVRDVERLARPVLGSILMAVLPQTLKERKILVHSVSEGLLDYGKVGTFLMDLMRRGFVSAEGAKRAVNSRRKIQELNGKGYHTSRFCFGYQPHPKEDYVFTIVDKEAALIREIYTRLDKGASTADVVRFLNAQHKGKSPKGGTWEHRQLNRMLDRPAYCGKAYNAQGRLMKSLSFPAIIEPALWDRIRARREKFAAVATPSRQSTHPTSGLLTCGGCGRPLYIHFVSRNKKAKKSQNVYYRCPSNVVTALKDRNPACRHSGCPEGDMLQLLSCFIPLSILKNKPVDVEAVRAKLATLEAQREDLIRQEASLFTEAHGFDAATVARQSTGIADRIKALEREITTLSNMPTDNEPPDWAMMAYATQRPWEMKPDVLKELLLDVFSKIEVFQDKVIFRFKAFDKPVTIERYPYGRARRIPEAKCMFLKTYPKNQKIVVRVFNDGWYYGDGNEAKLLSLPEIEVVTVGGNEARGKKDRPLADRPRVTADGYGKKVT